VISTFGIIVIVAVFIIKIIVITGNQYKMYEISDLLLVLVARFEFSIMLNGVNLQRGNVFIFVFVNYIAIEIIVIVIGIIEILEILL